MNCGCGADSIGHDLQHEIPVGPQSSRRSQPFNANCERSLKCLCFHTLGTDRPNGRGVRLVADEFKAENDELLAQIDRQLAELDPDNKTEKKKINALNKDRATIEERLTKTAGLMSEIGGQLTEEEARRLILKKLYDIANSELNRYLNAEKRHLIAAVENLWDKYAVSSRQLENARSETLATLDGFLAGLGYCE